MQTLLFTFLRRMPGAIANVVFGADKKWIVAVEYGGRSCRATEGNLDSAIKVALKSVGFEPIIADCTCYGSEDFFPPKCPFHTWSDE